MITKTEVIEQKFNLRLSSALPHTFNAAPAQRLPIITQAHSGLVQNFQFGYLPPLAASKYKGQINIKAESILKQGNNSRSYFNLVKSATRQQKCVVLANCFFEWHSQTKQPYVVYVRGQHYIFFAGICSTWIDKVTGEEVASFGIITQPGNSLMYKIGHYRQPKILTLQNYKFWLEANTFNEVSTFLTEQMPAGEMNAYPVSNLVNNPKNNGRDVIEPIAERVLPEYTLAKTTELKLLGMGETQARNRKKRIY